MSCNRRALSPNRPISQYTGGMSPYRPISQYTGGYLSPQRSLSPYNNASAYAWYGDSAGHSRASELGWQRRREQEGLGGRYDSRESAYGGVGSGWFGHPRAHAEAAREGWNTRYAEARALGTSPRSPLSPYRRY